MPSKPKGEWEHLADDAGDFIAYVSKGSGPDNSDRDESFTLYLPADPKRRKGCIRVIVDALNGSGIHP